MRYKRHKIKITREELKHDGFVDFIGKCVELYNTNKTKIFIFICSSALVLLLALGYWFYTQKLKENASFALYEASDTEELEAVFERFPRTPSGKIALYLSAVSCVRDGNSGKALALFDEFMRRYPSDYLMPGAMISVSCIKFDAGEWDESLNMLEKLLDKYPFSYAAPEALIYKGMIFEKKGDLYEALFQYKKISETYPGSFWVGEAGRKVSILSSNLNL
ncbi:MAG: tetratricopeptide repeat protein [bacterium]|nr:tetratricopeptide repeat protein [bacterium]